MVFVPVFEGFGIPPLEAMQCNIPVIASNTTSVPEITGDAALLVDPYNIDDIAGGMIRIKADKALRNELILRGNQRKSHFSWDKTSDLLWDSLIKIF
jgi:glycosyltransferase involved in cell wall biosynthesis